jgi:hypothetical protein
MTDDKKEKEFLEKMSQEKSRKQELSIALETISNEELLKLIEEMMNDPLF